MRNKTRKKAVLFDTLSYSMGLKQKGVKDSETYAFLLSDALTQNIYSKAEVDGMIDKSLQRFSREMGKIHKSIQVSQKKSEAESKAEIREIRAEAQQLRLDLERIATRTIMTTIGILGSLIVLVGAISTFSHAIFH